MPRLFSRRPIYFPGRYLLTTEGVESATPTTMRFTTSPTRTRALPTCRRSSTRHARQPDCRHPSTTFRFTTSRHNRPDIMDNPPVTAAFGITNFDSARSTKTMRGHSVWRAGGTDLGQRLRRTIVLFHPLQQSAIHPDPVGDLLINGVASGITHKSYTNGIQGDASYQVNRPIRSAPASPSAASRPSSAIRRWSSPA